MSEERTSSKTWIVVSVAAVVVVIAGLGLLAMKVMNPGPMAAPTSFTNASAPDNSFTCQAPEGWSGTGASANAVAGGMTFTSGSAKIRIVSDLQSSLMADITRAAGAFQPNPVPPVQKLHDTNRKLMDDMFPNYNETGTQPFRTRLGEGRFSEFTADKGLLGGKIHGYRVTILSNDRGISAICQCSETDWPTLKPVFERVVNSLSPGHS